MKTTNPLPTPCAAFDDDLKAHLDGELPFLRRVVLRRHLSQCPQCREELQLMQTLSEDLKMEETVPLDADLRAKILQNAPQPVAAVPLPNRRRTVKKLGLALAGVAFMAVGLNVSQQAPAPVADNMAQESTAKTSIGGPVAVQKQLPSAAPGAAGAVDATSTVSGAASARSANERSNALWRTANRADDLRASGAFKRETESVTRETRRSIDGSNLAFADGHVKWKNSQEKQGLSGYGSGIYTDNGNGYAPPQRAVHREGSVTVAVDNAETASQSVAGIIQNVGGFIATNSLSTGADGKRSATLDVRAPVEQFETLVAKIGALGTVRAKNINGEDITQRITQANARRSVMAKELSIDQTRLREKEASAKKRDAVLISQLRAEVRSSRLRAAQSRAEWEYLQKYAALSTLYVVLQDKTKPVEAAGWTSSLGPTGTQAWNTFTATAKLPLQLLIWILAYAPLWIPALIVWKKWGRKWVNA